MGAFLAYFKSCLDKREHATVEAGEVNCCSTVAHFDSEDDRFSHTFTRYSSHSPRSPHWLHD